MWSPAEIYKITLLVYRDRAVFQGFNQFEFKRLILKKLPRLFLAHVCADKFLLFSDNAPHLFFYCRQIIVGYRLWK